MLKNSLTAPLLIILGVLTACSKPPEVNIYSYRKEALIKPVLDKFSAETGIKVNLVTGKADALFQRLLNEGENTPADLLLTVDAGRLYRAKQAGVLQPIESTELTSAIPPQFRDSDNHWFGLSYRARVIMYNKDKVQPSQLSSYEDLAAETWHKQICIRSSDNIYNQSLLASLIAHLGEAAAQQWAMNIVANMARPPKGNDRSQMSGAAVGECSIAIANTYYMGHWLNSSNPSDVELASKLGVFFPNQDNRGAHINISAAGVTRHAKNQQNAVLLLEYLVSEASQKWYADTNHEYPVREGVPVSATVSPWGFPFTKDNLDLNLLGALNADAVKIFDKAGWQ